MRYALATLLIIFLLIVGVVVIVNQNNKDGSSVLTTGTNVADYASKPDTVVSYTIQGEIVGNDKFRSIRIVVTPDQRSLEILAGYDNKVIDHKNFDNNSSAFETFMQSLSKAGFGSARSSRPDSEQGFCPLGLRYVYTLDNAGKQIMRTWSDSCSRSDGNFVGSASTVQQLFQNQITDYNELTSDVSL